MPPYLRVVDASACWNASKMMRCFSSGMPMPVSMTLKAMTLEARSSASCPGVHPPVTGSTRSVTPPFSVNLKALPSRFFKTCCSRVASVWMARGRVGVSVTSKVRSLSEAT